MIAFHSDTNAILVAPFKSRKDSHRMLAYNEIMLILLFEALHDFVIGQHAMAIFSGFEGGN